MATGCREIAHLASDYVDGVLEPARRTEVDAHLTSCPECRALVHDLRQLVSTAARLESRDPSPAVWDRIAEQLRTEAAARSRKWRSVVLPLAAAAALLLAVAGGRLFIGQRSEPHAPAGSTVPTSPSPAGSRSQSNERLVQSIETELRLAEEHYEKAIAGLEAVAKTDETTMDPSLAAILQKNLAVIDQAIGESRAALRAHPDSRPAQESLFEAFRHKVSLLQDTVALVNEMRKGNQAEAARIVGELNR